MERKSKSVEKESKPGGRNSKSGKENQVQILGFPSPNQALSRGYADPQGVFSFLRRFPPQGRRGGGVACSLRVVFVSILRSLEQMKGWRHFPIARSHLDNPLERRFRPTWRPRASWGQPEGILSSADHKPKDWQVRLVEISCRKAPA